MPSKRFWTSEEPFSEGLLRKLQIAGVEQNPGPRRHYFRAVCSLDIQPGTGCVNCMSSQNWIYTQMCSGLRTDKEWTGTPSYSASCCPQTRPTPTSPTTSSKHTTPHTQRTCRSNNFRILQFNCNGLSHKISKVIYFMTEKEILVAAIQETKLMPLSN